MNFDQRPISRRSFNRFAAGASIGASITTLLASGCREVGRSATTLRFWNGFTGPDGPVMLGIVKAFNEQNDDVQVVMQRVPWDTYYNKVFVAGLGGRAPEVFVVQVDHLERFIWGKLCAPVDSLFIGTGALDANEFDANVLASARRGVTTYALPLDVHPMGVYYNRKLFADAGIAAPPTNRDEFVDVLHKLKKSGDGATTWGFVYEWLRINMYAFMRQWDANIVGPDLRTTLLDSPEADQAVSFAAELIKDGLVSPVQNTNALIGFRQGRVGMVWCGTFQLGEMQKQPDLDYGAAVLPILGKRPATWAGSHLMCLKPELNERERSAAERFIRFLSDHSLKWAEAGQVPVRPKLRESPKFKSMPVQSTFARQIPYVQYMPSTTFTREYQIAFDTACEKILRGDSELTNTQILANASTEIRAAAARFAHTTSGGGAS